MSSTLLVEHLTQQLHLACQGMSMLRRCVPLLCIIAHIGRAQGAIDALELGGVDEVLAKLVPAGGEVTLLDGTDDGRAVLAGELRCLADAYKCYGACPRDAMARNNACRRKLEREADTAQRGRADDLSATTTGVQPKAV